MNRSLLTTALCLALLPIGVTAFADDMPMPINADQVKWDPAPPNIPPGAQLAVIAGNPAAEGQPYVIRLKMPTNYKIPAHYHPVAESVTVISGEFSVGMGDKLDTQKGMALHPGGFTYAPAGMHHYGWTTGETVVQIDGNGPFGIVYINPDDDPSKGKAQ
jgi:quercetin dioxygenase-like cupin family protein